MCDGDILLCREGDGLPQLLCKTCGQVVAVLIGGACVRGGVFRRSVEGEFVAVDGHGKVTRRQLLVHSNNEVHKLVALHGARQKVDRKSVCLGGQRLVLRVARGGNILICHDRTAGNAR